MDDINIVKLFSCISLYEMWTRPDNQWKSNTDKVSRVVSYADTAKYS